MASKTGQIIGWSLFVLSAVGFMVSSLRAGDLPGFLGGALFLAGCVVFLLPLLRSSGS